MTILEEDEVLTGEKNDSKNSILYTKQGEMVVGNEVDITMFKSSGYNIRYADDTCIVDTDNSNVKLKCLKRFEFDRRTMTMSVIVEEMSNGNRWIFCKGSYEHIAECVKSETLPHNFIHMSTEMAREGYYALGMAYAPYNGGEKIEEVSRESVEKDLTCLGLLLFKNELKKDTPSVIQHLKEGKIRPVMITGDNVYTAIKISRECGMSTCRNIIIADCNKQNNNKLEWTDADTYVKYKTPAILLDKLMTGEAELAITGSALDKLHAMLEKEEKKDAEEKEKKNSSKSSLTSNHMEASATTNASSSSSPPSSSSSVPLPPSSSSDDLSFSSHTSFSLPPPPFLSGVTHNGSNNKNNNNNNNDNMNNSNNSMTVEEEDEIIGLNENQLTRFTRIYARVKPQQKISAVCMNMKLGVTGMCGDGANDAGALRVSHCGVAVSSASNSDANIVAPFSTSRKSLSSVVDIIKYGRCALSSAFSGYKSLIIYGQILVCLNIIKYYIGVVQSEAYWIAWDGVINVSMAWAVMQARPAVRLAPQRPTSKLVGLETFCSVALQLVLNWLTVAVAMIVLFRQPWFVCKEFDTSLVDPDAWWLKGDNYEAFVLSIIAIFQIMFTSFIVSFGFDYRRPCYRNYWLLTFLVMGFAFLSFILLSGPGAITCLFRSNCGDWYLVQKWGELGLIDKLHSRPITMPIGCPCNEQIAHSDTCEAEYINCTNHKYNQTYHHNILPTYFRWCLFAIILCNFILCIFAERVIILGPVRRYLRRRKEEKKIRKNKQEENALNNNNNNNSNYYYDKLIVGGVCNKDTIVFSSPPVCYNNNNNNDITNNNIEEMYRHNISDIKDDVNNLSTSGGIELVDKARGQITTGNDLSAGGTDAFIQCKTEDFFQENIH